MNQPNPALVTERAAQRLPRLVLWLLCAAYLLPGLFGRDPWKNADITAFGYMVSLARDGSNWLQPAIGGLVADATLLPYWLGAVFIRLLHPWVDPALAARIPFALLLGWVMVLTRQSSFHLARTPAAQPLPFAFGGEAQPLAYANAVADGTLLALIASLGLLQLGHETTPELGQLTGVALWLYAMACAPFQRWCSRAAMSVSLPIVAASGAPSVALGLCLGAVVLCLWVGQRGERHHLWGWSLVSGLLASAAALGLHTWGWRLETFSDVNAVILLLRQLLWFLWPAWPLALWTLWRWRAHWREQHIAVALLCTLVAVLASTAMGGNDRALLLALPPMAVLAAFALPTLGRSAAAAMDWFSVFFFSVFALGIWVMYAAMHTGIPAKPASNIVRLAVGFKPTFSLFALVLAALATLAWLWLVKWRTGRNRHPLWKSLVLPASGVTLCWLMVMTLWLPLLDYSRSLRPLVERIAVQVARVHNPASCVAALGLPRSQLAALEYFGHYQIDANALASTTVCQVLLQNETRSRKVTTPKGWEVMARVSRPADRDDITVIYQRLARSP
jgi:4-amino-4-deoxy-L-arabinose transferase-like glycosyltransferase